MSTKGHVTTAERLALERLVDRTSLHQVLLALATICFEKEAHVREHWQDEELAAEWARQGALVEKRGHVCRIAGL